MRYRVISADNHILEPPNLFIDRVPSKYRDPGPAPGARQRWRRRLEPGRLGSRRHHRPAVGPGRGQSGCTHPYRPRSLRWEELVPGNYDGAAHIKDMESDGIDAAVVYPQMVYRATAA